MKILRSCAVAYLTRSQRRSIINYKYTLKVIGRQMPNNTDQIQGSNSITNWQLAGEQIEICIEAPPLNIALFLFQLLMLIQRPSASQVRPTDDGSNCYPYINVTLSHVQIFNHSRTCKFHLPYISDLSVEVLTFQIFLLSDHQTFTTTPKVFPRWASSNYHSTFILVRNSGAISENYFLILANYHHIFLISTVVPP